MISGWMDVVYRIYVIAGSWSNKKIRNEKLNKINVNLLDSIPI